MKKVLIVMCFVLSAVVYSACSSGGDGGTPSVVDAGTISWEVAGSSVTVNGTVVNNGSAAANNTVLYFTFWSGNYMESDILDKKHEILGNIGAGETRAWEFKFQSVRGIKDVSMNISWDGKASDRAKQGVALPLSVEYE